MPMNSSPYATSIATNQTYNGANNSTGGYSNQNLWSQLGNGNQPWNTATFLGQNGFHAGPKAPNAFTSNGQGANADMYYSQGPQGQGWYQVMEPGQKAVAEQQYFTNQFNQNMPNLQNQMGAQFGQQVNQQMGGQLQQANSSNASRGMAYGGVGQGTQNAVRASAAGQAASGQNQINQGLLAEQSQVNSGAIQSGINYQQQQLAMQQQIYGQALQNLQAENSGTQGALQTAAMIGAIALL